MRIETLNKGRGKEVLRESFNGWLFSRRKAPRREPSCFRDYLLTANTRNFSCTNRTPLRLTLAHVPVVVADPSCLGFRTKAIATGALEDADVAVVVDPLDRTDTDLLAADFVTLTILR
jgi:hypothetical protein